MHNRLIGAESLQRCLAFTVTCLTQNDVQYNGKRWTVSLYVISTLACSVKCTPLLGRSALMTRCSMLLDAGVPIIYRPTSPFTAPTW